MTALYAFTAISLIISFASDKERTIKAIKLAWKKFNKILPGYMKLLIILSFVLLIPDEFIIKYLNSNSAGIGMIIGAVLGSITMMPGFIAYPLAGILVSKGVSYMVVAAFVSTLMMVGIATYPVEKQYFGDRATIIRNITSFAIAIIIAIVTGLLYGEVI